MWVMRRTGRPIVSGADGIFRGFFAMDGGAVIRQAWQQRGGRATEWIAAPSLLIAYWIGMFAVTHIPLSSSIPSPAHWDKVVHIVLYAGLAFLLACTAAARFRSTPLLLFGSAAAATMYGGIDELSQIPVGRTAELTDWLADVVGVMVGISAFLVAAAVMRRARAAD